MTVPLARQLHVTNLNLIGALGVFFPSEYNGKTGIYMLDPYEPGKIPVVFVHGLMSSPAAWTNAMNDLRGDPELRKRYQFWMFFYSTGNPLLASGARFRKALQRSTSELDPEHQDPAFDHMVLIGHSMGGLMSRLAISRSGQILWNTASKVPPDQVQLDPELKDLLMQAMFFEPVPIGQPRGLRLHAAPGQPAGRRARRPALLAADPRARATSWTSARRWPSSTATPTSRRRSGAPATPRAWPSSAWATPCSRRSTELPISDRVPYHSIVGYNGKEPLPAGGDGVVPYTSAHLEGALSELIVSSDHSAQETEAGILEMRRILTLHFNEYADERSAIAEGVRPPGRISRPDGETPVRYATVPNAEADEIERQKRLARIGIYPDPPTIRR